ncbi:MAG: hypothetical protein GC150_09960 [Rhizobiales bacterium]|nr:hypothetical protein [Hyphomicrobiales bacterium]
MWLTQESLQKKMSSAIADEATTLTEKYIETLLVEAEQQKITLQSFREALSSLAPALSNETEHDPADLKPLVFIIDELDRCTPPFALALLERIKHVLSVPNVQFVLGAHLAQLRTSVRATYGGDIDATTYLQKFIHVTVPLFDASEHKRNSAIRKYARYLACNLEFPGHHRDNSEHILDLLDLYAQHSTLTLRDLDRLYTIIALSFSIADNSTMFCPPLVAGLTILKLKHPELYKKGKDGHARVQRSCPHPSPRPRATK